MAALSSLRAGADQTWVDNAAHRLHHHRMCFPCDREIEAMASWRGHALLLSSDTDCLSLWDGEGLIRTARVGVYPQDLAVSGNTACVCGGADGRLRLLTLPALDTVHEIPLPGMPERIALRDGAAWVLTLMGDHAVQTALLAVDLIRGAYQELASYAGLPGAMLADSDGLWVAVSEQLLHFRHGASTPDQAVRGFGLVRRLYPCAHGVVALDPLEARAVWITAEPVPALVSLPCCDADFTRLIP